MNQFISQIDEKLKSIFPEKVNFHYGSLYLQNGQLEIAPAACRIFYSHMWAFFVCIQNTVIAADLKQVCFTAPTTILFIVINVLVATLRVNKGRQPCGFDWNGASHSNMVL